MSFTKYKLAKVALQAVYTAHLLLASGLSGLAAAIDFLWFWRKSRQLRYVRPRMSGYLSGLALLRLLPAWGTMLELACIISQFHFLLQITFPGRIH